MILIGDGDGNDSDTVREIEGPQAVASVPGGERCGLGFSLWPESSLAVVDKQAVVTRQKDLQAVCPQGSGLDARLVPLAETPAEARPEPEGAGQTAPQAEQESAVAFFQGYRAGAGQYPEERIDAMIQCESSWRIDPGGYHLGLAQFDPGTWATVSAITGYADPYNAFHQGFNVAVWAAMVSPGTTAGWPSCFHAIDW